MNGGSRFGTQPRHCTVASFARGSYCDIAVQTAWIPRCVTAFVAGVAIGCTSQARVGDMAGRLAVRGGKVTRMASVTLADNRHLGMAPFGWLPAGHCWAVTSLTIEGSWQMSCVLADGRCAIVTCYAIGCRCEQAVVGLYSQPYRRRYVATLTIARHSGVNGICRLTGDPKSIGIAKVASSALTRDGHIGMQPTRIPR
jgi:hypothetical protein